MNREFKFRGMDVKGKWHYGLLAHKEGSWYISNSFGNAYAFDVRPETVGQSTGSKDKNGKESYEGDIVNDDGVVVFAGCRFFITYSNGIYEDLFSDMDEVTGNIYENPELLEESE